MPSVQAHLLHTSRTCEEVSGLGAVLFFGQARSVVLDGGHTPGQHVQCQNTPISHINFSYVFSGFMVAEPRAHIHAGNHGLPHCGLPQCELHCV